MARIRAVGFDLDGTLFDHRGSASDAVDAFLGRLGVEATEDARSLWFEAEEVQFEQWRAGRISFQEQRRRRLLTVLPVLGIAAPERGENLDRLFEDFLHEYLASWRAFPDAVGVLAELRAGGVRLGVLTNGNQEQQLDKLRMVGLIELVDVVCTSEGVGVQKPDPRAFEALAARLGVDPAECLFVGDNPKQDIAGAVAAGMEAVLINHYSPSGAGLRAVVARAATAR